MFLCCIIYSRQAGLYDDATKLAKECMDEVNIELASEEEATRLVHLHGHLAEIETAVDM